MTERRRWIAVTLALAALAVGCGLSPDNEPHAIAPGNLPPGLLDPNPGTSTTLTGSPATTAVPVFFLVRVGDETRLTEVEREVADASSAAARVGALLTQPTADETDAGITTAIPADLILLDEPILDEDERTLTVNLSDELNRLEGAELTRAVAQIVYTATELDDVAQVRFLVEGEEIPVPDDEGVETTGPVGQADYRSLDPDR
jgi:spore germination protein GerM